MEQLTCMQTNEVYIKHRVLYTGLKYKYSGILSLSAVLTSTVSALNTVFTDVFVFLYSDYKE